MNGRPDSDLVERGSSKNTRFGDARDVAKLVAPHLLTAKRQALVGRVYSPDTPKEARWPRRFVVKKLNDSRSIPMRSGELGFPLRSGRMGLSRLHSLIRVGRSCGNFVFSDRAVAEIFEHTCSPKLSTCTGLFPLQTSGAKCNSTTVTLVVLSRQ